MIYTNFNFNNFNKKEDANKFILFGALLLVLGFSSFIFSGIGIKLISYAVASILLFFIYINLKNINELRRYEPNEKVRPYVIMQGVLIVLTLILLIYPQKVQAMISYVFGGYILLNSLLEFIRNKNNPMYHFGFLKVIKIMFGFMFILSPLFLSAFISNILSLIVIFIGLSLISNGRNLKLL